MIHFKRLFGLLLGILCTGVLWAQSPTIRWQSEISPIDSVTVEVTFTGQIGAGWHTYDLHSDYSSTRLTSSDTTQVVLVGTLTEPLASHRTFDETLGVEVGTYEQQIQLRQRVRAVVPEAIWAGTIAWQSCKGDQCNMPEEWNFRLTIAPNTATHDSQTTTHETIDTTIAGNDTHIVDKTSATNLWKLILMAISWGLLALLTPCVFPMIPMTVSFFLKGSESIAAGRFKAMMYGVFIVVLYTLPIAVIILLTRLLGGDTVTADIFNWIATHWLPNLLFFGIFMFFAASFFGAFEITLPSSIVNKSDRRADRGGLVGVFFMALTLVLVSFSCTGPIVGSALIGATSGAFWAPILTMLLFSTTFALPFTLFALFPSLLKNLPKSGGWLNSVKVCLGFIEIALGFKFLSVADQTYHWHLLDREVYLAIWIVCFTLLGFYLLGKLRFAHDSEVKNLSVGRLFLALVDFTFVVYLIPGMWGAPLRALSGYLPPLHTQDFVLTAQPQATSTLPTTPQVKYGDLLTSPPGVEGFFDLQEAIAEVHRTNKPLFIDVTGHGCVNCREMEQRVFTNERVQAMLRNFVVVSLYTDDKSPVAPADYLTTDSGTQLRELGRINAYLVRTRYGINAQPGYVVADEAGDAIVQPWSYELDVDKFLAHLRKGLVAYHNKASQQ